jgi:tRNA threonylcarbamoyladenosine modification (KEOPS) complex  Pcc1 subunit
MKASATILFTFSSEKQLRSVISALYPETQDPTGRSVDVDIESVDRSLSLKVTAPNTTALRSALNAYLRWTRSITDLTRLLDDT